MMIISLEGMQGSGKSLTAVALLYIDWIRYGKKIFCNNHLNFPGEKIIVEDENGEPTEFLELELEQEDGKVEKIMRQAPIYYDTISFLEYLKANELENCDVLMDEMQILMDSRASSSKLNRLVSQYIIQTRKRGVDLFVCAQHILNVDVRLRRAINVRGTCDYRVEDPCKECKGTGSINSRKNGTVVCSRCNGKGVTGFATTYFVQRRPKKKWMIELPGPYYWDLYSTREVIPMTGQVLRIKEKDL